MPGTSARQQVPATGVTADSATTAPAPRSPADQDQAEAAREGGQPVSARPRLAARVKLIIPALLPALRQHWLATALVTAGLVMRVLVMIAYRPALMYVDTLKYLYGVWSGSDPVGYKVPLKIILLVGNLTTVAAVQHVLGLAMAVTLYLLLVRRGSPRWLAAIAIAPVLFDGYQLQSEQTIMPDVWFEALIVTGLAVLLWKPTITTRACVAAGILLGATATVRQVGEILVLPALIFVMLTAGGWRHAIRKGIALLLAFATPILFYMLASYDINHHFSLSRTGVAATYGRMAAVADCATLKLPPGLRPLCPSAAEQKVGPDRLDHDNNSPAKVFTPPPGLSRNAAISEFDNSVLKQQPLRVLSAIGSDFVKLYEVHRVTDQGETPISRWQFQARYPTYLDISISSAHVIIVGLKQVGGPVLYRPLNPAYGGPVEVNQPLASFLHAYQLDGGYTPGPLLLLLTITGFIGSLAALFGRRFRGVQRQLTLACLLFFTAAIADLVVSDVFEFSWRYQLPVIVTLVPGGILGLAAILRSAGLRAGSRHAGTPAGRHPQLATPAS
jgi:hypothetical protein